MTAFAELAAATNFSFLRGASHASDMIAEALRLGMAGIGIADRNSVAGVVRAHVALRNARAAATDEGLPPVDFRLVVGARLVFADTTPDIVAYPTTRHGWGRLTRLLTTGNLRVAKGDCHLTITDLLEFADEMLLIVMPPDAGQLARVENALPRIAAAFPGAVWLGATMPRRGNDRRRLARLMALAAHAEVPLLATNDALYAHAGQRPLHDVMTCIGAKTSIAAAGRILAANAERHLKSPAEMTRLFRDCPQALAASADILARIHFSLDQLSYEYPHEPVPDGWAPQDWLEHLVTTKAQERYPEGIPRRMRELIAEEFILIRRMNYAYYFLTVHDIVAFARSVDPPILCQGRGSAANSAVCYLLGITSVDPARYNLLFSRFVSEERDEPPDIDVDFEHERREEVMQYIYRRYGRHRAGIAATVIHYRPRSAVREVGKALGFSEDVTARMGSTIWGSFAGTMEEARVTGAGFSLDNPDIARFKKVVDAILMAPRHLSQHVGGFILTQDRLDETVPIHNAAMADRTFIEWDKDDIDALKLMKVDVLALGMLSAIRKGFALIETHIGKQYRLDNIPEDQGDVYDMLCRADSVGVFQVESRAQMNMLPRLRPRLLYDLVIQVAIVRPGPIQGDMVHPYLRRRQGRETVEYPSPSPEHGPPDELFRVLGKTLGVPLFQEQAMQLAIAAAKFTPSEANQLRRAMATFRHVGTMDRFHEKMVGGMTRRGYTPEFAQRCYQQIEGFGSYGFPESHALSFARLVYVSSYLKCRYPAVFACALLNAQPMGFYAPAQIVRDAREHGVTVHPLDINASDWDNSLEGEEILPGTGRGTSETGGGAQAGGPDLARPSPPAPAPPPSCGWSPFPCRGGSSTRTTHADAGLALRIGFRQMDGFRRDWADRLVAARAAGGAFASIEDIARRATLPQAALRKLADADAFGSLGLDRRAALWAARRTPDGELPLFAAAQARELGEEADLPLPAMPAAEQVAVDYQTMRLSLKGHPMQYLRPAFASAGVMDCATATGARNGALVRCAGIVLVRQRPGNGNAIFATLEDESGVANILIWARLFETYRRAIMASRLMLVDAEVQRSPEGVVHLMVSRVEDRSALLACLTEGGVPVDLSRADEFLHPQHPRTSTHPGAARPDPAAPRLALPQPTPPRLGHPRQVRILPKSRDFH